MNDSSENGIVRLEDLPQKETYVKLDNESFKCIINKIKEKGNITNFLIYADVKNSNFWGWYTNKSLIRLDNLVKIKKCLNLKEINILCFRGKQGKFIKKLKFNFKNPAGVRLIACILGDGCIHKNGIRYINSDIKLINGFIEDTKQIFGDVDFALGKNKKNVYIVYLSKICMKIVRQLGIEPGSKISNNVRIPRFIYSLPNRLVINFISQFIDDEGGINDGKLTIDLAFDSYNKPLLMYDLKELFLKLKVEPSVFKIRGVYKSKRGNDRQEWRLGIFSYSNLSKLKLSLLSDLKKEKFEKIINSPRRSHLYTKTYFNLLKEASRDQKHFTIYDISNVFNKDLKYSRKVICNLYKENLLESFREISKDGNKSTHVKYFIPQLK